MNDIIRPSNSLVPMVLESDGRGERAMDLYSKMLGDRIIFVNGGVDDNMSSLICAQLLYLEQKDSTADIQMYINSPGGSVTAGLAIKATMDFIKPDVVTVVYGLAASMGALLLSSGAKGKRCAMADSRIMIHQVSSGTRGTYMDQAVTLRETEYLNHRLHEILSENTGQDIEKLKQDCSRDFYMGPQESKDYGMVDKVIKFRSDLG